jgi:arabinan endo-1,5-alpha-L-arabinosidase
MRRDAWLFPFLLIVASCSGEDAGDEATIPSSSQMVEGGNSPGATNDDAGSSSGSAEAAVPEPPPRTFKNAVFERDCPDPGITRVLEEGKPVFYMVCTGGRFILRRSTDLLSWKDTTAFLLPDGKASWSDNGRRNWAPEIHALGPKQESGPFVAYFTAADADDRLAIGVAHADSILGPWTTDAAPLVRHAIGVIDATFFIDSRTGKRFLYWKVDGNQRGEPTPILVRELNADGRSFAAGSVAKEVLRNDNATWEGGVAEAPWIVEHDGMYFMFYSGNVYDERYRTGVARSSSPLGPFVKKGGAPIMGNNAKWLGPGHGSIVKGTKAASTEDWFVHHAWVASAANPATADRDKGRWVLLDRVKWEGSGQNAWPRFEGSGSLIGTQDAP